MLPPAEKLQNVFGVFLQFQIGVDNDVVFVTWEVWDSMKILYGRQYVTAQDLEPFRVRFTGAVLFLDYVSQKQPSLKRGAEK